ncbi:titin-like [Anneissia japonica]|uniref:titin-like n=1 Tax=Anneissia japonica TaxID=1529436 RepID=UPI0014259530|nr:titin-like [Anneissia japonica]
MDSDVDIDLDDILPYDGRTVTVYPTTFEPSVPKTIETSQEAIPVYWPVDDHKLDVIDRVPVRVAQDIITESTKRTTTTTLTKTIDNVDGIQKGELRTPPAFTKFINHCRLYEADEARFDVAVIGDPTPDIMWFKNGIQIEHSPEFHVRVEADGSSSLIVPRTQITDSGQITCRAENSAGVASCTAKLIVEVLPSDVEQKMHSSLLVAPEEYTSDIEILLEPRTKITPPTFTSYMSNQDVLVGSTVSFKCSVSGYPRPTVRWFKNGKELRPGGRINIRITQDGSCVLEIRMIQSSDAAKYMIKASNPAGEATCVADLHVKVDMYDSDLSEPRREMKVHILQDRLQPHPGYVHVTKERGQPDIITQQVITREGSDTEEFQFIRKKTTTTTTTTVTETVTEEESAPEDQIRPVVQPLNIYPMSFAPPPINIKLSFEGVPHGYVPIPYDEQLPEAPRFVQLLHDTVAIEGESIQLECFVTGSPPLRILWFKGKTPIANSPNFQYVVQGNRILLILREVFLRDEGEYTCHAENKYGTATCTTSLKVVASKSDLSEDISMQDAYKTSKKTTTITEEILTSDLEKPERVKPPRFLNELLDIEVTEGSTAKFDAKVTGYPMPVIRWYSDGLEIQAGGRYTIQYDDFGHCSLTILDLKREDSADIECRAINIAGEEASSYADLIVKPTQVKEKKPKRKRKEAGIIIESGEKPRFLKKVVACDVQRGKTAQFLCQVNGNPKPKVTWFKDGRPIVSTSNVTVTESANGYCSLTIHQVEDTDEGEYMCKALNELGKAICYADLVVDISEDVRAISDEDVVTADDILFEVETSESTSVRSVTKILIPVEPKKTLVPQEVAKDIDQKEVVVMPVSFTVKEPDSQAQLPDYIEEPSSESFMPTIVVPLQDGVGQIGRDVRLECKVFGIPTPEIKWLMNGKPAHGNRYISLLEMDGTCILVISIIKDDHGAIYECRATNVLGTAFTSCKIMVLAEKTAISEGISDRFYPVEFQVKVPKMEEESEDATKRLVTESIFKPSAVLRQKSEVEVEPKQVDSRHGVLEFTFQGRQDARDIKVEAVPKVVNVVSENYFKQRQVADRQKSEASVEPAKVDVKRPELEFTFQRDNIKVEATPEEAIPKEVVDVVSESYFKQKQVVDRQKSEASVTPAKMNFKQPELEFTFQRGQEVFGEVIIEGSPEGTIESRTVLSHNGESIETITKTTKTTVTETITTMPTEQDARQHDVHERQTSILEISGKPETFEPLEFIFDTQGAGFSKDREREHMPDEEVHLSSIDFQKPIMKEIKSDPTIAEPQTIKMAFHPPERVEIILSPEKIEKPSFNISIQPVDKKEVHVETEKVIEGEMPKDESSLIIPEETIDVDFHEILQSVDKAAEEHVEKFYEPEEFSPREMIFEIHKPEAIEQIQEDIIEQEPLLKLDFVKPDVVEHKPNAEELYPVDRAEVNLTTPRVVRPLDDIDISVGEDARLECQITGKPRPRITWLRDGKPVEGKRFFSLHEQNGTCVLLISPVCKEDDAEFECHAENSEGVISTYADMILMECKTAVTNELHKTDVLIDTEDIPIQPAELQIQVPQPSELEELVPEYEDYVDIHEEQLLENVPTVLVPLHDLEVPLAGDVRLECQIIGNPPPTISWKREQESVSGERYVALQEKNGYCVLLISPVTEQDDTVFECKAENVVGTVSTTSQVTVTKDTTIKATEIHETEVTMPSPVKSIQPQEKKEVHFKTEEIIQEEKTDVDLSVSLEECIDVDFDQMLNSVDTVVERHVEEYHKAAEVSPRESTFEIFKPEFSEQTQEEIFDEQESPLKLDFAKKELVPIKHVEELCSIDTADVILAAPKVVRPLNDVDIGIGDDAILECQITGNPRPDITWLRDGKPVEGERFISFHESDGTCVLKINLVCEDDDAEFECHAENSEGVVSTYADIILMEYETTITDEFYKTDVLIETDDGPLQPVEFKIQVPQPSESEELVPEYEDYVEIQEEQLLGNVPTVLIPLQDLEVPLAGDARLECQIIGQPKPAISWIRDQEFISGERYVALQEKSGNCVLLISPVTEQDNTVFECKAENVVGTVSTTSQVTVNKDTSFETTETHEAKLTMPSRVTISIQPVEKKEVHIKTEEITEGEMPDVEEVSLEVIEECIDVDFDEVLKSVDTVVERHVEEYHETAEDSPREMTFEISKPKMIEQVREEIIEEEPELVEPKPDVILAAPKVLRPLNDVDIDQIQEDIIEQEPLLKLDFVKPDVVEHKPNAEELYPVDRAEVNLTTPRVVRPLDDIDISVGEDARLECQITGKPRPRITWLRDGKPVEGKRFFSLHEQNGTCVLLISPVCKEDDAEFECHAENSEGVISTYADMILMECKTAVTNELHKTDVLIDTEDIPIQPAELQIQVPQPSELEELVPEYEDYVEIQEEQLLGNVPTVLVPLQDLEVPLAGDARLECQIIGQPKPAISWIRDQEFISGERYVALQEKSGNCVLLISPVTEQDNTVFECKAENVVGTVSTTSQVTVNADTSFETTETHEAKLTMPSRVTISIQPVDKKEVHIKTEEITESEMPDVEEVSLEVIEECIDVDFDEVLKSVDTVVERHVEEYHETTEVSPREMTFEISKPKMIEQVQEEIIEEEPELVEPKPDVILAAPKVLRPLNDVDIDVGKEARLECQITGNPRPDITWLRNGEPVKSERFISFHESDGTYVLLISPVFEEDDAEFECHAENSEGVVSTYADIILTEYETTITDELHKTDVLIETEDRPLQPVEFKIQVPQPSESEELVPEYEDYVEIQEEQLLGNVPTVLVPLQDLEVPLAGDARLECQIIGQPKPAISWIRDQEFISGERYVALQEKSGNCVLLISPVTEQDNTVFECKAENVVGTVSTTSQVTVNKDTSFETTETHEAKLAMPSRVTISIQPVDKKEVHINTEEITEGEMPDVEVSLSVVEECIDVDFDEIIKSVDTVVERHVEEYHKAAEVSPREMTFEICKPKMIEQAQEEIIEQEPLLTLDSAKPELVEPKPDVEKLRLVDTADVILAAPKVLRPLNDVDIDVGKEARLECQITGNPQPDITWLRNGKPVKSERFISLHESDGTCVLLISPVCEEDDAEFECHAENSEGVVSTYADIILMEYKTTITDEVHKTDVLIDTEDRPLQPVEFRIQVPQPSESEELVPEYEDYVEIHEEQLLGNVPTVLVPLQDLEVPVAGDARLECQIIGKPTPTISWIRDQKFISGERYVALQEKSGSCLLFISPVTEQDNTVFECKAENVVGTVSTTSQVTVMKETSFETNETHKSKETMPSRVMISIQPLDKKEVHIETEEITEGEMPDVEVSLSVVEECIDVDFDEILESVDTVVDRHVKEYHEAAEVSPREMTFEICKPKIIEQAQEEIIEEEPELIKPKPDVMLAAPRVMRPLNDVDIDIGKEARLECQIRGHPQPDITWLRNGKPVISERYISFHESDGTCVLLISPVCEEDDAEFECHAENSEGVVSTYADIILTEYETTITDELHKTDVLIETEDRPLQPVEFKMQVPKPSESEELVPEYEDYVEIVEDTSVTETHTTVVTRTTEFETFQPIELVIENEGKFIPEYVEYREEEESEKEVSFEPLPKTTEEAVQEITVTEHVEVVFEKPSLLIKVELYDVYANTGQDVRLECQIVGNPSPNLSWIKDGKVLDKPNCICLFEADGTCVLIITPFSDQDQGLYQCVGINPAGKVVTSAVVKCNEVPGDINGEVKSKPKEKHILDIGLNTAINVVSDDSGMIKKITKQRTITTTTKDTADVVDDDVQCTQDIDLPRENMLQKFMDSLPLESDHAIEDIVDSEVTEEQVVMDKFKQESSAGFRKQNAIDKQVQLPQKPQVNKMEPVHVELIQGYKEFVEVGQKPHVEIPIESFQPQSMPVTQEEQPLLQISIKSSQPISEKLPEKSVEVKVLKESRFGKVEQIETDTIERDTQSLPAVELKLGEKVERSKEPIEILEEEHLSRVTTDGCTPLPIENIPMSEKFKVDIDVQEPKYANEQGLALAEIVIDVETDGMIKQDIIQNETVTEKMEININNKRVSTVEAITIDHVEHVTEIPQYEIITESAEVADLDSVAIHFQPTEYTEMQLQPEELLQGEMPEICYSVPVEHISVDFGEILPSKKMVEKEKAYPVEVEDISSAKVTFNICQPEAVEHLDEDIIEEFPKEETQSAVRKKSNIVDVMYESEKVLKVLDEVDVETPIETFQPKSIPVTQEDTLIHEHEQEIKIPEEQPKFQISIKTSQPILEKLTEKSEIQKAEVEVLKESRFGKYEQIRTDITIERDTQSLPAVELKLGKEFERSEEPFEILEEEHLHRVSTDGGTPLSIENIPTSGKSKTDTDEQGLSLVEIVIDVETDEMVKQKVIQDETITEKNEVNIIERISTAEDIKIDHVEHVTELPQYEIITGSLEVPELDTVAIHFQPTENTEMQLQPEELLKGEMPEICYFVPVEHISVDFGEILPSKELVEKEKAYPVEVEDVSSAKVTFNICQPEAVEHLDEDIIEEFPKEETQSFVRKKSNIVDVMYESEKVLKVLDEVDVETPIETFQPKSIPVTQEDTLIHEHEQEIKIPEEQPKFQISIKTSQPILEKLTEKSEIQKAEVEALKESRFGKYEQIRTEVTIERDTQSLPAVELKLGKEVERSEEPFEILEEQHLSRVTTDGGTPLSIENIPMSGKSKVDTDEQGLSPVEIVIDVEADEMVKHKIILDETITEKNEVNILERISTAEDIKIDHVEHVTELPQYEIITGSPEVPELDTVAIHFQPTEKTEMQLQPEELLKGEMPEICYSVPVEHISVDFGGILPSKKMVEKEKAYPVEVEDISPAKMAFDICQPEPIEHLQEDIIEEVPKEETKSAVPKESNLVDVMYESRKVLKALDEVEDDVETPIETFQPQSIPVTQEDTLVGEHEQEIEIPEEQPQFQISIEISQPILEKLPEKKEKTKSAIPKEPNIVDVIYESPKVLKALNDVEVNVGDDARLECKISGSPQPKITWLSDGKPVKSDRFLSLYEKDGTCVLLISPVMREDDVEFECHAENTEGTVSTYGDIIISRFETDVIHKKEVSIDAGHQNLQFVEQQIEIPEEQTEVEFVIEATNKDVPHKQIEDISVSENLKVDILQERQDTEICSVNLVTGVKEEEVVNSKFSEKVVTEKMDNKLYELELVTNYEEMKIVKLPEQVLYRDRDIFAPTEHVPVEMSPSKEFVVDEQEAYPKEVKYLSSIGIEYNVCKPETQEDIEQDLTDVSVPTIEQPDNVVAQPQGEEPLTLPKIDSKLTSPKMAVIEQELETPLKPVLERVSESAQTKLKIIKRLDDVETLLGNVVTLHCQIESYPEAEIQWYRNGTLLSKDDKYEMLQNDHGIAELHIKSVEEEDDTEFECRATNSVGKVSTYCEVIIEELRFKRGACTVKQKTMIMSTCDQLELVNIERPLAKSDNINSGTHICCPYPFLKERQAVIGTVPCFVKQLFPVACCLDESVHFTTKVVGIPYPSIQWFKNGRPVVGERYCVTVNTDGLIELRINHVCFGDIGTFECKAVNCHGVAIVITKLTVKDDLNILTDNQANDVPCLYVDKEVKSDSQTLSKFNKIKMFETQSNMKSVFKPIIFLKPLPPEINTDIGGTVRLECSILGYPKPLVEWLIDGKHVTGDRFVSIHSNDDRAVLVITPVKQSDQGIIQCRGSHPMGSASCFSMLNVFEKARPKQFVTKKSLKAEASTLLPLVQLPKLVIQNCDVDQGAFQFIDSKPRPCSTEHCSTVQQLEILQTGKIPNENFMVNSSDEEKKRHETNATVTGKSVLMFDSVICKRPQSVIHRNLLSNTDDDSALEDEASSSINKQCPIQNERTAVISNETKKDWQVEKSLSDSTETAAVFGSFVSSKTTEIIAKTEYSLEHDLIQSLEKDCQVNFQRIGSISHSNKILRKSDDSKIHEHNNESTLNHIETSIEKGNVQIERSSYSTDSDDSLIKENIQTVSYKQSERNMHGMFENEHLQQLTFCKELNNCRSKVGGTACFECQATPSPLTSVMWFRDGSLLTAGERFIMINDSDGNCFLVIYPIFDGDEGVYECQIGDHNHRTSTFGSLILDREVEKLNTLKSVKLDDEINNSATPWMDKKSNVAYNVQHGIMNEDDLVKSETMVIQDKFLAAGPLHLPGVAEPQLIVPEDTSKTKEGKPTDITSVQKMLKDVIENVQSPIFTRELYMVQTHKDTEVRFECQVTGNPQPSIKWFKAGEPLQGDGYVILNQIDGSSMLLISNATEEDETVFKCRATNEHGEAHTSAALELLAFDKEEDVLELATGERKSEPEEQRLEIRETKSSPISQLSVPPPTPPKAKVEVTMQPPRFITTLEDLEIVEGNNAVFEVQVTGSAPISIRWLKDEQELEPSKDFKIRFDGKFYVLEIVDVFVDDCGNYVCEATNPVGLAVCEAKLNVTEEPDELPRLEESKPTPEEKKVPSHDIPVIEIQPPVEISASVIQFVPKKPHVTEEFVQSEFHFQVEEAPISEVSELSIIPEVEECAPYFTKVLETKSIAVDGESVFFQCAVAGVPRPQVTWYVDNNEITDEPEYIVKHTEEGICELHIQEIIPEDEGYYTCKAVNHLGEVTCTAQLLVEEVSLTVTEADAVVKSEEEVSVDLSSYEATIQTEEEQITQTVEETTTGEEEKMIIFTTETEPVIQFQEQEKPVEIPDLKSKQEGKEKPSNFVALGSYLAESDEVMSIREGEDLHILDSTHGDWWLVRKSTGEEGWVPSSYLVSTEQYEEHLEEELANSMRALPTGTELTLQGEAKAPHFSKPLETTKTKDNKPVTLKCCVEGYPTPIVAWYRQSTLIPESPDFEVRYDGKVCTLTIKDVLPEDSGKYTCVAKNQVGAASSSAELLVEVSVSDAESIDSGHTLQSRKSLSRESTVDEPEGLKPAFMQLAKPKSVQEGTKKVVFEFKLIAAPRPQIAWYHDGLPLEESKQYKTSMYADVHLYILTLEILDIVDDNEGNYKVEAKNKEGEATAVVKLNVSKATPEPPRFVQPLSSLTVQEGEIAKFECIATGVPRPDITWCRDNQEINHGGAFKIHDDGKDKYSITLKDSVPEDSGTITCWAENDVGRTMCGAELTVIEEPVQTEVTVMKHEEVITTEIKMEHKPKVTYAVVEEEVEEIPAPPTFVVPAADVDVQKGAIAELRAKVSGSPMPEVTWYRDGKVVQPSERYLIMSDNEGNVSLIIADVRIEDDAEYLCKAINNYGVTSCRADIIVEEEPTEMAEAASKAMQEIFLEQAKVEAEIIIASEVYSESEDALDDDNFEMVEEVAALTKELSTETVPAVVAEEPVEESVVKDEQFEEPKFVEEMVDMEIIKGHPAQFEVLVSGIPRPIISWFKDGKEIFPDDHILMEYDEDGMACLTVKETNSDDDAEYTCKAVNKFGEAVSKADIFIQPQYKKPVEGTMPTFIEELKFIRAYEGDSVNFICKIKGMPEPDVMWYKNSIEIKPNPKVSMDYDKDGLCILLIRNIDVSDKGTYMCKAVNKIGEAVTMSDLVIEVPAKILDGPSTITVNAGECIKATFTFTGFPVPTVFWSRGYVEVEETEHIHVETLETETSLLIDKCVASDAGEYAVEAENNAGGQERYVNIIVKDVPGSPSKPQVSKITKTSVQLTWQPPHMDGGYDVSQYHVEQLDFHQHTWTLVKSYSNMSVEIDNLYPGNEYCFRVSAENILGVGAPSEESDTITTDKSPEPPRSLDKVDTLGPRGMTGLADLLEWDVVGLLAVFVAFCYLLMSFII